jgi:hypothetical protein
MIQKGLTMGLSVTANQNEINALTNTTTLGPTLSISKTLIKKKIRTSLATSYNRSESNKKISAQNYNTRLTAATTLAKKHNLNLSAVYLYNDRYGRNARRYSEYTITVGYTYNFSILDGIEIKKKKHTTETATKEDIKTDTTIPPLNDNKTIEKNK